jgi:hypothetical protein
MARTVTPIGQIRAHGRRGNELRPRAGSGKSGRGAAAEAGASFRVGAARPARHGTAAATPAKTALAAGASARDIAWVPVGGRAAHCCPRPGCCLAVVPVVIVQARCQ